jgi:hypothetical protein
MPAKSVFQATLDAANLKPPTPTTHTTQQDDDVPGTDIPLAPSASVAKGVGRPNGKRSDPNYQATTVLLRKATKKKATRLLEDMGEDMKERQDLSELLEKLLGEWVEKNT